MRYSKILVLIVSIPILFACHKDPPKTYDDTDMTVTNYNPDFNFQSYSTFFVPDSTILKTNYLTEGEVSKFYEPGSTSDNTLELITQSFVSLGYTQVDSLAQSDFIAVPTILMMKSDETIWYGPGWWWGYPGYGWGIGIGIGFGFKDSDYWGWWYPGYAWYPQGVPVTVSTYKGTVVYEVLDTYSYLQVLEWNEINPEPEPNENPPQLEINWQAMVEGYTTDDGSYNQQRAVRGTGEAFAQSPYLIK